MAYDDLGHFASMPSQSYSGVQTPIENSIALDLPLRDTAFVAIFASVTEQHAPCVGHLNGHHLADHGNQLPHALTT